MTAPAALAAEQAAALDIARALAAAGIPVFTCRFAGWGHGTNKTGYWFPDAWQQTPPGPAGVAGWMPGMALGAVMGRGLDLIDVDPRNGADLAVLAGAVPVSYGAATTPSGGVHTFIASIGEHSRDAVAPGIDFKGGGPDGQGRGFAFIAPTVKVSKVTGELAAYRWAKVPDLAALAAGGDGSGRAFAELVRAARAAGNGHSGTGHGGAGGGHDGQMAAYCLKLAHAGLADDEIYPLWRAKADAEQDDSWPFTDADFGRHMAGARRKYAEHAAARNWGRPDPAAGPGPAPATPAAGIPAAPQFADEAAAQAWAEGIDPAGFYAGQEGIRADLLGRVITAMGPLAAGTDNLIWRYAGGVWRPARYIARDRAVKLLGDRYRPSYAKLAEDVVLARAPAIGSEPVEWCLNVPNGLLDWRTGILHPHTPAVLSTVQLGTPWDAGATCPVFDWWLAQVVPPDCTELVWELAGYLAYSGNPLHTAVMLTGDGRNGKGTFLRVILAMLGKANVTSASLADLAGVRFTTASLYGKLANISGDIDGTYLESTATFKAITGGDQISAENKGKDRFDFTPWAVPVFSANKIPASADTTAGYLSRWLIIPFPNSFAGREDRSIEARLLAELPGILAAGVRRLPALLARGQFGLTDSARAAKAEFERRVDQVRYWLGECCERGDFPLVNRNRLYSAYRAWVLRDGGKPVRASEFYDRIAAAGIPPGAENGVRGFRGIKVTDEAMGAGMYP